MDFGDAPENVLEVIDLDGCHEWSAHATVRVGVLGQTRGIENGVSSTRKVAIHRVLPCDLLADGPILIVADPFVFVCELLSE